MMHLGEVAAGLGLPVFPCRTNKKPVVKTGFKAATRDAAAIASAFALPGAKLIGVPTGRASGFVAIDIDVRDDRSGMAWLNENREALPETRTHKTRTGGLHLLFRVPDDTEIRNSAGRIAPGVDVRGEGGYLIMPPSPGYSVADPIEPAEMPRWLIRACLKSDPEPPPSAPPRDVSDRYAAAALDGEVLAVMRAAEGQRNHTLNVAAAKLGSLVASGLLSRSTVEAELGRAAHHAGLDAREIAATIRSGLEYGMQFPRTPPERSAPGRNGAGRPEPPPPEPPPDDAGYWDKAEPDDDEAPRAQLRITNPVDLEFKAVPEREWIVPDWLPVGSVTASYGDGGVGKTLLAQQLMTSCATGAPWCRLETLRCRTFGLFCEDPEDEMHRRQVQICAALGVRLSDLGDMRWVSGVGQDNVLATFTPDGRMHETERFGAIAKAATEFGARLVILDTAADLFAGNENDRHQVRQFIGLLNRLAMQINGAVLLNAHPSRTGLSTGNLDGGSTAWSNSVRSRWSLARPQAEEDDGHGDTAERVLTQRKANYAGIGDTIKLRWVNGLLSPVTQEGGIASAVHRAAAETVFLDLLDRCDAQNLYVSHSKNAANFAPKVFAQRSDRQGYTRKEFEGAMMRLFEQRKISMATYGRSGDARQRIVRVGVQPANDE